MKLAELNHKAENQSHPKLIKAIEQFQRLLDELNKKELTDNIVSGINEHINEINSSDKEGKRLASQIKSSQSKIFKFLEKELKIVPKGYYQTTWMAIGMAAFGIPMGVAFGTSLGNMAFIGIGMPIGMVIGMAMGANMDKKAKAEGRQLDFEMKV